MYIHTMFCRYLKLFKQKRSRYVSWDTLLFWGIVLWIALCASNMYHSNILKHEATLSYLQNSNFEIPYNISTKPEIMEEMLHIKTASYSTYNMILMSVFQYVHVFMSMFFIIIFMCSQEYVKKMIKIWNAMACKNYPFVLHFTFLDKNLEKDSTFSLNMCNCVDTDLQTKLTVKFESCGEHLQTKLNRDNKENVYALGKNKNLNILNTNIYITRNEIIFNSYTLLLFNSFELYRFYSNQQLRNSLIHKYLTDQNSVYIKDNLTSVNNYKRSDDLPKNYLQKGVISSSPEFQQFLVNLKKSPFLHPYMLEVTSTYTIHIKSSYKGLFYEPGFK